MPRPAVQRVLVAGVALAVAGFATLRPIDTTFNVTAVTETVNVRLDGESRLELGGALVFRDTARRGVPLRGAAVVPPGSFLVFERIANGPLRVAIDAGNGTGVTLLDSMEQATGPAVSLITFRIDAPLALADRGESVVVPFTGHVDLGAEVGQSPGRAMLREGRVNLLGHTFFGDRLYEAGRVDLDRGDRLAVDSAMPAVGFVTADENPGLTVVYRTRGRSAQVSRFGASGYEIATSWRARILNDHMIQGLWATFFALLGLWGRLRPRKDGAGSGGSQ